MQRLISLGTFGLILAAGYNFLTDGSITGRQTSSPRQPAPVAQAPIQSSSYPPAVVPPPASRAPAAAPRPTTPTMRLAAFNVQVFGATKEKNLPVMQTLAAVMRNFDIIAIQEIRINDDYLLRRFIDTYLNPYSGQTYDYVLGPRLGRSVSKEQYAFIYNTARIEVNPNHIYTIRDPNDLLHRPPLVAMFRTRGPQPHEAFTFVLVNVHTDPDDADEEVNYLALAYQAVRGASHGEDDIILLGDFNADDKKLGDLGRVPGVRPLIAGVFSTTQQNALYDNIVVHRPSTSEFTGQAGVYDIQRWHNLTLDQALMVSDHLPVWAEFSIYEARAPGRVAARPQ